MKAPAIKFANTDHAAFAKELRSKMKSYFAENNISKFGNLNLATKSIVMSLLYALPFIAMLLGVVSTPLVMFIAWFVMGLGMAGVGMVLMHDANHGAFSKRKWVNQLLSKSMYFLGGFPINWRYQHNTMHHGYTNIDGYDEDISPVGILRFSPHKPIYKIHRYQHIYAWFFYGLMTLSWVIYKDFVQLARYKRENAKLDSKKSFASLFINLVLAKLFYYGVFLVLPIALNPAMWSYIVLGFLLMHFVCGFILGIVFQTAHVMTVTEYPKADEKGQLQTNWLIHQLKTTTNYSPKSKWFSWMIGGLNYQVEHHLFPQVSHVHYPQLSKLVKDTAEKYNIPYFVEPSFAIALKSHYRMLKVLGRTTLN